MLIDETTGKATRVDFRPLPLEMILRSRRRDAPLLLGYLVESLLIAAQKIVPDFAPFPRREPPKPIERREFDPMSGDLERRTFPVWRRSRGGQGLAEYALILGLIAIVAIVALQFLGSQVNALLSRIGESV
jgi:Flp pilus assembly pilin Flp